MMASSCRRRTGAFRIAAVALLIAALGGLSASAWAREDLLMGRLSPRTAARPPYDLRTITVRFREGVSLARRDGVAAALGGQVERAAMYVPGLCTVTIPVGVSVPAAIAQYRQRLDVLYAEPTYFDYPAFIPNDPLFSQQWDFPLIHVPEAWDKQHGGSSSVIVAVLDTGVAFENYTDPGSGDSFVVAPDLVGANFVSPRDIVVGDAHPNDQGETGNYGDPNNGGHGTHVTGTIAQATNNSLGVAGVAFGVSIMPVRTLGPNGGSHQQFSDGVHWAVDHGAKVINYSAGGSDSTTKHDAVTYAYNNGVLLVAAYGNDASNNPATGFPGQYPQAMGVGAVDRNKALAYYSNFGDGVDVVAPGGDTTASTANGVIQNTFQGDPRSTANFNYYSWMGTSMATPHVTGLAALLLSEGTYSTRQAVFDRITSTCEDLGTAGYDTTFGWGLINANAALPAADAPPVLSWAGTTGFTTDGVNPNTGNPSSTVFTFRVKITDLDGDKLTKAQVRIDQLLCSTWKTYKTLTLAAARTGSLKTGKLYSATTTLPNAVYRYVFLVADHGGAATGAPATPHSGPMIVGPGFLCWLGGKGYETDGVNPDSGTPGTRFVFAAIYRDSQGLGPTKTKTVELRLNGRLYRTLTLVPQRGGSYTSGRVMQISAVLTRAGKYQYRFQCDDGSGMATGAPALWTNGPVVTTGLTAAVVLTAMSAVPSNLGAQITFNLSDAAAATATVYNIAGRPIRVLARERPLAAGPNTLIWDRRNDGGLSVPSGLYLIRVQAAGEDGTTSMGLATVVIQ